MRSHLPWLCQGDLFRDVPIVDCTLQGRATIRPRISNGPALLLTHDCAMDKRTKSGLPRVERLQFAPLKVVSAEQGSRGRTIRGDARR